MLSATAVLLSLPLLQFPPIVIVPPSVELKEKLKDVLSLVGLGTAVTSFSDGAVVSIVKEVTDWVI